MTNSATLKPRSKKTDRALRHKVGALRAASGERAKSQGSTAALNPIELLRLADGTVYEPDYWEFIKGASVVLDTDSKFDRSCGDKQWRKAAEQLLRLAPERLNAREKGFLYALALWKGPGPIPLKHLRTAHRLCSALTDFEETT